MIKLALLSLALATAFASPAAFREKYGPLIDGTPMLQGSQLSSGLIDAMYHDFLKAFRADEPQLTRYLGLEKDRKQVFAQNLETIRAHNQDESNTWKMGISKFSDMTWEEFKAYHLMEPQHCSATNTVHVPAPARSFLQTIVGNNDINWKELGKVSDVKDQGNCGSCWTFSTTGVIESRYAIKYDGHIPLLSEQQLIDCAEAFDNHGCNGGLPSQAFEYIHYQGGLEEETQYPYEVRDFSCRYEDKFASIHLGHSINITAGDNLALENALQNGPVSVTFQVVDDFMHYASGVYQSKNCKNGPMDVNHAVLAVGLGTEGGSLFKAGTPYFYVKNSWGHMWGDEGYFKIKRGKENMCGILTCNSFPSEVNAA